LAVTTTALRKRGSGHAHGRRRLPIALALLIAVLSLAQGDVAASQTNSTKRSPVTVMSCYEKQVVAAVNNTRMQYGLRSLRLVPGLMRSAGSHSLQMAVKGYFAHSSPNGASFFTRVKSFYGGGSPRYFSAGENLLWTDPHVGPSEVVRRWLASPEHRRVLLSPVWTVLGVGVVSSPHGPGVFQGRAVTLVTADFAVKR